MRPKREECRRSVCSALASPCKRRCFLTSSRHEIQIVTPNDQEQEFVHDIYMNELVKGMIRDETRDRLLSIAGRMKIDDGIEGLLLGGTELSLIIKSLDGTGLELLDTMKIQVQAAIAEMLS